MGLKKLEPIIGTYLPLTRYSVVVKEHRYCNLVASFQNLVVLKCKPRQCNSLLCVSVFSFEKRRDNNHTRFIGLLYMLNILIHIEHLKCVICYVVLK